MRCSTAARPRASSTSPRHRHGRRRPSRPSASPRAPAASSASTRSAYRPTGTPSSRSPSEHGLFLLEDAACAVGGTFEAGRAAPSVTSRSSRCTPARASPPARAAWWSPTTPTLAARVRRRPASGMRSAFARQGAGAPRDPEFADVGYNYKLSDVLAAIALVQLDKLDGFLARRRASPTATPRCSPTCPGSRRRASPATGCRPGRPTRSPSTTDVDRDAVGPGAACPRDRLDDRHLRAAPRAGLRRTRRLPVSDVLFRRHLALPMYADLTDADQDRVVETAARRSLTTRRVILARSPGRPSPTSRAGTPDGAACRPGTSRVTTEPAPMTHRLPIVTPISTTPLAPMNVWSPMHHRRALDVDRAVGDAARRGRVGVDLHARPRGRTRGR